MPLKLPRKRSGTARSRKLKHKAYRPVGFKRAATGHLIVEARLGRHSRLHFLVDSGASQSVIAASSRALPDVDLSVLELAEAKAAGGELPSVRIIPLKTLRVGAWRFRGVTAAIMELGSLFERLGIIIDGVLGQDVLSRQGFSLDLDAGEIAFTSRRQRASSRGARYAHFSAVLTLRSNLIEVKVRAAGKQPIAGLLDLGAARTLANTAGLAYLGGRLLAVDPSRPTPLGTGADARPMVMRRAVVGPFGIGDLKFPSRRINVADLPVFQILGYQNKPVLLLGLDLFEDKQLTVNFKARRLTISLPHSGRRTPGQRAKPMESDLAP
jgi:hypothetical protein